MVRLLLIAILLFLIRTGYVVFFLRILLNYFVTEVLVVLAFSSDDSTHHILRDSRHELLVVFYPAKFFTEWRHFVEEFDTFREGFAELHIFNDVDAWVLIEVLDAFALHDENRVLAHRLEVLLIHILEAISIGKLII